MVEKEVSLNAEYIDQHINDMSWLRASERTEQFEMIIKSILEDVKNKIGDGEAKSLTFPINVKVEPYIFGLCVDIYINKIKVGHA